MKKIALIGGGANNLFLASLLSKYSNDIEVDIIEIRDRVGKKILETGNGKCNFSNVNITKEDYNNETFVEHIINKDIVNEFNKLGLLSYNDNEGRCYPCSDSANSILDLLRFTYLSNNNFKEITNTYVNEIKKEKNGYILKYNNIEKYYDFVVLAIGSKVNNNAYKLLNLDLKINKYSPSLCPISTDVSTLKGIRVKCVAKLFDDNKLIYQEKGEVIFKDNAISGISIFNISFYINKYKLSNPFLSLDLFPHLEEEQLYSFLLNKVNKKTNDLFIGILNKMIGQYIIKRLNLKEILTNNDIKTIANTLKQLTFKINGLVDNPQVAKGGIDVSEINNNLELVKYSNIFIGGEMIDIDGKCGGYNLHFAFSSALEIFNELKERLHV